LAKWNSGACNGKTFHRVEDWVIQGCDPKGDGSGGETNLPTEISKENFSAGSLGVARKMLPKDLSNDSQFFITKKDSNFLNAEYTYFGKVLTGMEIVNNISAGDKILSVSLLTK
jgi:peptidyl-prolyl cis-trans isomerase B (cyclophilin B)